MVSKKQLKANKQNALKSTGPVTEKGKKIVAQNAMKHGILSSKVVLENESRNDYQKLCKEFDRDLKPMGIVEKILVRQVVDNYWRLQRVKLAEQGAIMKRLGSYRWKQIQKRMEESDEHFDSSLYSYVHRKLRNSLSCAKAINLFEELIETTEQDGYLDEEDLKKYIRLKGLTVYKEESRIFGYFAELAAGMIKGDRKKGKKGLIDYLKNDLKFAQRARDIAEEMEDEQDKAGEMMVSSPCSKEVDRLGRYEASLEKSLYRALNELEKLQVLRKGGKVFTAKAINLEGISQK